MDELKPKINRIVFGLAALCFFLPFVNFSCADMTVASVSGFDMVFGSSVEFAGMDAMAQLAQQSPDREGAPTLTPENQMSRQVEPNAIAIIALACCMIGLFLSFSDSDRLRYPRILLACAAAATLVFLRVSIGSEVESQGGGIIQVDSAIGFWLCLILLAGAIYLNYTTESTPDGPFIRARIDRPQGRVDQIRRSDMPPAPTESRPPTR